MGAGRKKPMLNLKGRIPSSSSSSSLPGNISVSARNLRKSDLGGVIFGCTQTTIKECMLKLLFGLPAFHFSYVKNVNPDLPLFLFNYSDRKLHGIFEAASPGQMNINPYGWSEDGSERTWYPAQVRVRIRMQCKPLIEDHFRPIINTNYYTDNHFWFELDRCQTSKLISLFSSSPFTASTCVPRNLPNWNSVLRVLPTPDTNLDGEFTHSHRTNTACSSSSVAPFSNVESQWPPASVTATTSIPQNMVKWSSLFKAAPKPDSKKDSEDLRHPSSEAVFAHSDQSNTELCSSEANYGHSGWSDTELEPSGVTPCLDGESKPLPTSKVGVLHSALDDAEWDSDTEWDSQGVTYCLDGESKPLPFSEVDVSHSACSNTEWESSSVTPCFDEESQPPPASEADFTLGVSQSFHGQSQSSLASVRDFVHSAQSHAEWISSGASLCLDGENQPPKALDIESDQSNNGWSSSGITPLNGKNQQFEAHLDLDGINKNEEELVYMKLKELALKRDSLGGHAKDTDIPFVSNDTHSEDECVKGPPTVPKGNYETFSVSSPVLQPIIDQLMQRLEELKDFQLEQIQKTSSLQQKLAMVTRGDPGAELTVKELPLLQEEVISMCRGMGKAVILATNMLEGMINHTTTQPEVSDIDIAVTEGNSDAVMLPRDSAA